jgi:hypothetical protein
MKNREEWEVRGHEIVMEMVEAVVNAPKRNDGLPSAVKYVVDCNPEAVLMVGNYVEC